MSSKCIMRNCLGPYWKQCWDSTHTDNEHWLPRYSVHDMPMIFKSIFMISRHQLRQNNWGTSSSKQFAKCLFLRKGQSCNSALIGLWRNGVMSAESNCGGLGQQQHCLVPVLWRKGALPRVTLQAPNRQHSTVLFWEILLQVIHFF